MQSYTMKKKVMTFILIQGLLVGACLQNQITRIEKTGMVPDGLENGLKKGFQKLAGEIELKNGKAEGKVKVSGKVTTSKKLIIKQSGNYLKAFSTFFGELLDSLENQNNQIEVMLTVTGKDPTTKEMTNKVLVQLKSEDGQDFYLGAIEYPFRTDGSRSIPKFIQSETIQDVLGFLGIDSASVAQGEAQKVNAFQRGETSGDMCSRCSVKTEIFGENEEIRKFQMQLEFLGRRIKDLLKKVRTAKGEAKAEALADLKRAKKQQSELEDDLLEKELEEEAEKARKEKEKEDALRSQIEKEIWARMADLEAGKAKDMDEKLGAAGDKLGDLEKKWAEQRAKREAQLKKYEEVQDRVKGLEDKLGGAGDAQGEPLGQVGKRIEEAQKRLKELEQQLEKENKKKEDLEEQRKELEGDLGDLEKQEQNGKNNLENLRKMNDMKIVELEKLQKVKDKEEGDRAKLAKEIQLKLAKIKLLTEAKKEKEAEKDELQNDLTRKREIVNGLEEAIEDQNEAKKQVKDALEDQETRRKGLQDQFDDLGRRIADLRDKLEKEKKLRDDLENDILKGRETEKNLNDQLKMMRDKASSLPGSDFDDRIRDLRDAIGKVGEQIGEKEKQAAQLEAEIRRLEGELAGQRQKREEVDGRIKAKKEALEGLKKEVKDKRGTLLEKQDQVKDMGQEHDDLVKLIREMDGKILLNLDKLEEFKVGIEQKQKELDEVTQKVEQMENDTQPSPAELKGQEDQDKPRRENEPKVKDQSAVENDSVPTTVEPSGSVSVISAGPEGVGGLHEYELQLTDVSEELTFVDLKSFAENEPHLRQQVFELEKDRDMGQADRSQVKDMLAQYEDQWKQTRDVYWKEKEMRSWTEMQTKAWQDKMDQLRQKLQREVQLRRMMEQKGTHVKAQIELLKKELSHNDLLMQQAQSECEKLLQQLETLKLMVEKKRKMEEELRLKNFLIKRRILKFKKTDNDLDLDFPTGGWNTSSSQKSRRMVWSSPVTVTKYQSLPLDNTLKTNESSWKVVHKRAFVNGKEVDPANVTSNAFENKSSIDSFLKSNGFGDKMESHGFDFSNSIKLPVLDSSSIVKRESARVGLASPMQRKQSSGVKVKRRIKQATFKKKGGAGLFN